MYTSRGPRTPPCLPYPLARGSVGKKISAGNGFLGKLSVVVGSRRLRSHGSPFTLKRNSTSPTLSSGSSLVARPASIPPGVPMAQSYAPCPAPKSSNSRYLPANDSLSRHPHDFLPAWSHHSSLLLATLVRCQLIVAAACCTSHASVSWFSGQLTPECFCLDLHFLHGSFSSVVTR